MKYRDAMKMIVDTIFFFGVSDPKLKVKQDKIGFRVYYSCDTEATTELQDEVTEMTLFMKIKY